MTMTYLKKSVVLLAVGKRIRYIREKKSLTQKDIASKAGIAISQVGRIERGEINSSVSTLFVISDAMKTELKNLFELKKFKSKRSRKRMLNKKFNI